MLETTWRYVQSSLVTFVAGVALVVVPEINNLTLASLSDGALLGLLFAGARLGVKMVLELYLAWYSGGVK